MKRRIFDRQFKIEAVRLACSADMTVTQTARTLNISATTLYRWLSAFDVQKPLLKEQTSGAISSPAVPYIVPSGKMARYDSLVSCLIFGIATAWRATNFVPVAFQKTTRGAGTLTSV